MGSGRTHAHFYRGCGPPRKSKRPGQQHAPDSMMTETAWEHQREVTCGKAGQEQPQALRHTTAARLCNAHGGGGRELWGKVLLQLQALGQSRRCAAAALAATAQENRIWFPTRPVAPNRGPFSGPQFCPLEGVHRQSVDALWGQNWGPLSGSHFGASLSSTIQKKNSNSDAGTPARVHSISVWKRKVPRTTRGWEHKRGNRARAELREKDSAQRYDHARMYCSLAVSCHCSRRPMRWPLCRHGLPTRCLLLSSLPLFLARRKIFQLRARACSAACRLQHSFSQLASSLPRSRSAFRLQPCFLALPRHAPSPVLVPCFLSYDHVPPCR